MIIKELIEELAKFDLGLEVFVDDEDGLRDPSPHDFIFPANDYRKMAEKAVVL